AFGLGPFIAPLRWWRRNSIPRNRLRSDRGSHKADRDPVNLPQGSNWLYDVQTQ
ncbi:uncharacterized protein METZ01_LOCUS162055, partial [marine metagenome]